MIKWIQVWLTAPVFASDEEKTRVAGVMHVLLLSLTLLLVGMGCFSWLSQQKPLLILSYFLASLLVLAMFPLVRRGHVRIAGYILLGCGWLASAIVAYFGGGMRSGLLIVVYLTEIVMAGALLGGIEVLIMTSLTTLTLLVFYGMDMSGLLPPARDIGASLFLQTVQYMLFFCFSAFAVYSATSSLRRMLRHLRHNRATLETMNRELQATQSALERRVSERVEDLSRRSRYLEATVQVAALANAIFDVEQLLSQVVVLIREKFEVHYVGLFTTDAEAEWAILRAGTGEAGAALLARGTRIKRGQGSVGWCLEHGKARLADYSAGDAARLLAPELALTRSEVALPMRSRGKLLGVIAVQSSRENFFDGALLGILQTMSDLVAAALDSTQLLGEGQQALDRAMRAYGGISREAWSELLATRSDWGYRYVNHQLAPVRGPWRAEMTRALRQGQPISQSDATMASLSVPLRVREQVVGVISFRKPGDDSLWSDDEARLLQALCLQLEQALENARLLEDSQQHAALEQQINAMADQFSRAVDVDAMLRVAARELGRLPGVAEVSVHLELPEPSA